ncbi:MAG: NAD(P)/FAD-dependent oxidoreductase, partial [Myxococcota bacterium]
LVVGAGISGICAAYYLQTHCPNKSFTVLEARDRLGGTWDLFQYPGIRSDSDMFTLGFSFHPWSSAKAIADGPAIMDYLYETVEAHNLGPSLQYGHRVEHVHWSSADQRWTVEARRTATGEPVTFTCAFLWGCTGYYRYEEGYTPDFPGVDRFKGQVVHPQQWTDDVVYADKRVVVIGSGATAVTLVPALAPEALHVTMLQRSPSYILSRPMEDVVARWLSDRLPETLAYTAARWKNVLVSMLLYQYSRRFPERARRFYMNHVRQELGEGFDVETHFNPKYNPWDQRLCLVPNSDLFEAFKSGRASVVTDHIETFTEEGLVLRSGRVLEADLIVTATGLQIQVMGGATMDIDGSPVAASETMMYKGAMLSDVPNMALSLGYTNASWTLKCELTSEYIARLLNYMDRHGYTRCCPRRNDPDLREEPLLDLNSGYVTRARNLIPHQGSRTPWRLYQNYILDHMMLRWGRMDDQALEFA